MPDEDQRRNMTPDQIAGEVVALHNYERARGEKGRFAYDQDAPGDGPDRNNLTRTRLAKQAGVSQFQIERARTIQLADPELLKQVVAGAISAADALIKVKTQTPRVPRQPQAPAEDAQPAQRQGTPRERETKDRMIRVLSRVHGLCRGFDTMSIPALHNACNAKEIKEWVNIARSAARVLRSFALDLEEQGEQRETHEQV